MTTLKRQDVKICTEDEAFRLPHIGRRIAQKIEEIVATDRLQRLKYAQGSPTDGVLQLFLQIYGIGTRQARQWIAQGHRTLDDLVRKAKLTPSQAIAIAHHDDLQTRIPRREVKALGVVVRRAAARIDPEAELIVGGSYCRGAESSSDIDLMVTRRGTATAGSCGRYWTGWCGGSTSCWCRRRRWAGRSSTSWATTSSTAACGCWRPRRACG